MLNTSENAYNGNDRQHCLNGHNCHSVISYLACVHTVHISKLLNNTLGLCAAPPTSQYVVHGVHSNMFSLMLSAPDVCQLQIYSSDSTTPATLFRSKQQNPVCRCLGYVLLWLRTGTAYKHGFVLATRAYADTHPEDVLANALWAQMMTMLLLRGAWENDSGSAGSSCIQGFRFGKYERDTAFRYNVQENGEKCAHPVMNVCNHTNKRSIVLYCKILASGAR